MNLQNSYFVFQQALPDKLCNDIIKFGEEKTLTTALVGGENKAPENENDLKKLYKQRNSSIAWLDEPWIWKNIQPYILEANTEAGWNFQLDFSESAQWTRYSKDQHYSWHMDAFPKPFHEPRDKTFGLIRKLSVTVSLEDGDKYTGGDLEFLINKGTKNEHHIAHVARLKGTITVFPSFVWHRVTPVTQGTRYSLVVWTLGQPYK